MKDHQATTNRALLQGTPAPHDVGAEAAVLGSILVDESAIARVLDLVAPDDFYRETNGQVYEAALRLFRDGRPVDNVTLAAELDRLGVLDRIGGRSRPQESGP